jgi:hypothetical protein
MCLLVSGFALPFFQPPSAALLCCMVPAFLIGSFRTQLRDLDGFAVLINSDEREIARVGVPPLARHELFGFHANADFHRGAPHEVDARLHDDEIAKMYRLAEIDAIDGRGDHGRAAVSKG